MLSRLISLIRTFIITRYSSMQNLKIALLFVLLPLLLNAQQTAAEFTQSIESTFQNAGIPGLAVSIVSKDSILYEHAMGYADVATQRAYARNSVLNIGSISKTLIGVALLQLSEAGRIDLDIDINEYLPFSVSNPHYPERPITLRQLATHTSSIRDRSWNYDMRAYVSDDDQKGNRKGLPLLTRIQFKRMLKNEHLPLGEFLEKTLSAEGQFYSKKNYYKIPAGTEAHYSNIGAALAAFVVERVSGTPYRQYVAQNILNPLGMTSAGWHFTDFDENVVATRYIRQVPIPDYELITYPDGGLVCSTADLARYLMAMMRGYYGQSEFLPASAFQQLMSNQLESSILAETMSDPEERSGIFWDLYGKEKTSEIGHSGGDPGILTLMYFDPQNGLGCVLTTNCSGDDTQGAVVKIWQDMVRYRDSLAPKHDN